MNKVKQAIEERNDALDTLERIHNENPQGELDEDAQKEWDEAQEIVNEKEAFLDRQETIDNSKDYSANVIREQSKGEEETLNKFKFSEAIAYAQQPNSIETYKAGYYEEMSQEAEKEMKSSGITPEGNSVSIPYNVLTNKFSNDLTVGTEGDDVVDTKFGGWIDTLKESLVFSDIGGNGARIMTGLEQDQHFPRRTNRGKGNWEGENDDSQEHTPSYDNVKMSPKRLALQVDVSNQMIRQTRPDIEQMIQEDLLLEAKLNLEGVAIASASAASPEGILDIGGNSDLSTGSGSLLTWDKVVNLETQVAENDALMGSVAYLTNNKVLGELKTIVKESGEARYLYNDTTGRMNGYEVARTNLVPSDLTTGGGSSLSALIFGNFRDLLIGQWGGIEILRNPYSQAGKGITEIHMNMYADVAVRRDESFAYYADVTTS